MSSETPRLRVVLADDEPMARTSVRALLSRDPEVELVAECANGMQAVEAVRALHPDILFLDIQMPGMGGFDVIEALEDEQLPVIVFATAFDRYALDAFEVHAVDYILKPFDDERFAKALEHAKERVRQSSATQQSELFPELFATLGEGIAAAQGAGSGALRRLTVRREGRVEIIDTNTLMWIEAADQYVVLHTQTGEILMRESMGQLERDLDPARFQRVHRSAIVALDQIRALERFSGGAGRVQVDDDKWLPVSRSRLAALKRRLG